MAEDCWRQNYGIGDEERRWQMVETMQGYLCSLMISQRIGTTTGERRRLDGADAFGDVGRRRVAKEVSDQGGGSGEAKMVLMGEAVDRRQAADGGSMAQLREGSLAMARRTAETRRDEDDEWRRRGGVYRSDSAAVPSCGCGGGLKEWWIETMEER
ncbi:hypothetical protein PIB30_096981 [Stylosanthes scabra]|uniref:Uncharacterized protein n=1 Tax=Stylosanthes scabra TaxID=79078 RepID=A0ABU6SWW7_9FABA|nr:hypothetical protein [Stylosanthes scabra]